MCKTIKQRVKFKAPPATVYDLLADSRKHTAVTGRKATISRKIGGTFSTGGNDVTGVNGTQRHYAPRPVPLTSRDVVAWAPVTTSCPRASSSTKVVCSWPHLRPADRQGLHADGRDEAQGRRGAQSDCRVRAL